MVSTLKGALLDFWVSTALNWRNWRGKHIEAVIQDSVCVVFDHEGLLVPFDPSRNWLLGGPLIESYLVELIPQDAHWDDVDPQYWLARIRHDHEFLVAEQTGGSALEAAMRCIVDWRFGESVLARSDESPDVHSS